MEPQKTVRRGRVAISMDLLEHMLLFPENGLKLLAFVPDFNKLWALIEGERCPEVPTGHVVPEVRITYERLDNGKVNIKDIATE